MGGKVAELPGVLDDVRSGMTVMFGGFGGVGTPPALVLGLVETGARDLVIICNDAGWPPVGIAPLITEKRVRRLITSHIGSNQVAGEQMNRGELEVEFCPQGTLAERIRAGGAGLGGVLVDVGSGTVVERHKQKIELDGVSWMVEPALTADVAFIHAAKADAMGNLVYRKTARNFNPLMAMAGRVTIVEAEEIVPVGALDPECIVTPGIFVDIVVQSRGIPWKWVWEVDAQ